MGIDSVLNEVNDQMSTYLINSEISNFNESNEQINNKLEIIVTFLALLEMIKTSEIICKQKDIFGQIEIKLNITAKA